MTPLEEVQRLLAVAENETQFRTVASRGYFAAYTRTVALAEKVGFAPARTSDDHKNLFSFLKNHKTELLVRIGVRLGRMRSLRNRADYVASHHFSKAFAYDVVSDAEQIEAWSKVVEAALAAPRAASQVAEPPKDVEPGRRSEGRA